MFTIESNMLLISATYLLCTCRDGYDKKGYDKNGYDKNGYDKYVLCDPRRHSLTNMSIGLWSGLRGAAYRSRSADRTVADKCSCLNIYVQPESVYGPCTKVTEQCT